MSKSTDRAARLWELQGLRLSVGRDLRAIDDEISRLVDDYAREGCPQTRQDAQGPTNAGEAKQ